MRVITYISRLLALLIIAALPGCAFLGALFGMEDSQRDWVGDHSAGGKHSEEQMRAQAELDRIYN